MEKQSRPSLFKMLKEDLFLLVKVNILFVVACVPVISIPAAVTAMVKIFTERIRGREVDPVPDFMLYLRVGFFTSMRTGAAVAVSAVLFGYVLWFYQSALSEAHLALSALRGIASIQFLTVYLTSCYLWVIEAVADVPFFFALKRAFQMMIVYLRQTALCLLAGVLIFGGSFLLLPYSAAFMIVIGFALWAYICAYYVFPIVEQYIPLS